MRGRRPAGPEYVKQVPGSETAKQRALLILQTIAGDLRLSQACEVLDICPQRFDQLRAEALAALVASLEPGTPGRPPRTPSPQEEQIRALEADHAARDLELRTANVRAEIALTLPRVVQEPGPGAAPEKKTRHQPGPPGKRRKRRRGQPPGTRTNT